MLLPLIAIAVVLAFIAFRLHCAARTDLAQVTAALESFNFAALANLLDRNESAFLRERLTPGHLWRLNAHRMSTAIQYLNELDALMKKLASAVEASTLVERDTVLRQIPSIRWMVLRLKIRAGISVVVPGLHLPAGRLYDMHGTLMSALAGGSSSRAESLS
jgi:hypothetical protein